MQTLSANQTSRNLLGSSQTSPKSSFSLYFLNGNDQRELNSSQKGQILQIILTSNLKTSTLVYNSHEIRRKYTKWISTFPWIKAYYAIKSNPSRPLLEDLVQQGCYFDCASRKEIQAILDLGVSPSNLVYSNSIKQQQDLEWAGQQNVPLTTADTIGQLLKIRKLAPKMKILWRISIKQEDHDKNLTAFSGKFGDDLQNDKMIHARMLQIKQMDINLHGVHFHCGSGQHGSSAFRKAILLARRCIEIGRIYGHDMLMMDIGGGFPAGELTENTINALQITKNDPLGYKVIAEPGRHFCSYSFYLLTKILGKRIKNQKPCYHLNQSLYHSFNCNVMDGVSFQNSQTQFYSKLDCKSNQINQILEKQNATLFGMTCDGIDIITKNIYAPTNMEIGDWLCVGGMGAYTFGSRTEFNGMKSIQKVIKWSARVDQQKTHQELGLGCSAQV